MKYETIITLDGKKVKRFVSKKGFDWENEENFIDEIENKFGNYKFIESTSDVDDGYYIGYIPEKKTAFCIGWKRTVYTDLKDIDGNTIKVGDFVVDVNNNKYELNETSSFFCSRLSFLF